MNLESIDSLLPSETVDADICIVGSGFAGLTIARELDGGGARILLLESGGRDLDPRSDSLNEIESIGAPREMDQSLLRNRIFGGTSSTWSGRIAAFDEMDFARRDWIPNSGWPISRDEFARYLPRSMVHLGAAVADNTRTDLLWKAIGGSAAGPSFDLTLLRHYFWSYSKDAANPRDAMRLGPRSLAEQALNVRCLLNATVTHIDTNAEGDAVEGLELAAPDGQRRRVRARFTVLCAGAIENARLLLASNRKLRSGVGNQNGLVGRYLMDHPRGVIGHFRSPDYLAVQRIFGDHRVRMSGETVRLVYGTALSPVIQRAEGLLNCAAWIAGPRASDDPWASLKRLARRRGDPVRNIIDFVRSPGLVAEGLRRYFIDKRSLLMRMDDITLECIVEQQPDPNSRVTLAERTDASGMPLSRIDWRISEREARTVRRLGQLFVAEMRRLGLPVPVLIDMVADSKATFLLPDVAHPMGTTRMSDDSRFGVVDTNCAVHGVRGLYVAGSSIFPTGGHANPTQTIVAMAVRLADHLKGKLKSANPEAIPS